jgi:hypothetical protein
LELINKTALSLVNYWSDPNLAFGLDKHNILLKRGMDKHNFSYRGNKPSNKFYHRIKLI